MMKIEMKKRCLVLMLSVVCSGMPWTWLAMGQEPKGKKEADLRAEAEKLLVKELPIKEGTEARFSPDGKFLLVWGRESTKVSLWNVADGKLVRDFTPTVKAPAGGVAYV